MGARRPKPDPQLPSREDEVKKALDRLEGVACTTPAAETEDAPPRFLFQSIRVKGGVHKLRFGVSSALVEAKDDQTIEFQHVPFDHFLVMPSGVMIPLANVTSVIPMGASINAKLSRQGRLAARAERLQGKMQEAAKPKIQEVDDDDFVDESIGEDEEETAGVDES